MYKLSEHQATTAQSSIGVLSDLWSFFYTNIKQISAIFITYMVTILSIGIVNYPYIDDVGRQVSGSTGFASSYARYFSEYSSYLVQGSHHLTDLGLTTFILSAVIMSIVSVLVLFLIFDGKRITWISALTSVLLGINPWFLEALSFRFDSPYICLSVLVSVIPFLFYKKNTVHYFLISTICIFLMCNAYQASSGIYPVMLLLLVFKDLIQNTNILDSLKKVGISIAAYGAAMAMFFVEMSFNPQLQERGTNTTLATLSDMPNAITENYRVYFQTLCNQSAKVWILLLFLAVLLFVFQFLLIDKQIKSFFYSIIYIVIGAYLSYGVYAAFARHLAADRPRYAYGFAFFITLALIMSGKRINNYYFKLPRNIILGLLVYYMCSFSFTYSTALAAQKDSFEFQSTILAQDLSKYNKSNSAIYINKFFNDSPIFKNTAVNYPILSALVPSNSDLYWPNLMWFNNLTQLNASFTPLGPGVVDQSKLKLLVSNQYYDIYQQDKKLFVFMK